MTHYAPGKRSARLEREIESLLRRISDTNRPLVKKLADRMRVKGRGGKGGKPGSIRAFVNACFKADQVLAGRPFGAIKDDDEALGELLAGVTEGHSGAYASNLSVHIRRIYAHLHGKRKPQDLPGPVYDALYVAEPTRGVHGYVIPDEDFEAMLRYAADMDGKISTLHRGFMFVVLLWVLRDCGWRISEALSLNWSDCLFDEKGVRFLLREEAEGLKTGSRPVYAARCAAALKAWASLHPRGTDPHAPVFIGLRDRTGFKRGDYQTFERKVKAIARECGASAKVPDGSDITPHDFRHTRATEWARNNEGSEEAMRKYFGWRPGSKMPSYYIHFALGDQKETVLRAAALSPLGTRLPTVEVGASAEDLALLKKLRKLLAE